MMDTEKGVASFLQQHLEKALLQPEQHFNSRMGMYKIQIKIFPLVTTTKAVTCGVQAWAGVPGIIDMRLPSNKL